MGRPRTRTRIRTHRILRTHPIPRTRTHRILRTRRIPRTRTHRILRIRIRPRTGFRTHRIPRTRIRLRTGFRTHRIPRTRIRPRPRLRTLLKGRLKGHPDLPRAHPHTRSRLRLRIPGVRRFLRSWRLVRRRRFKSAFADIGTFPYLGMKRSRAFTTRGTLCHDPMSNAKKRAV